MLPKLPHGMSSNPENSTEEPSPYAPPGTEPVATDGAPCPVCGERMELGELWSSSLIRWRGRRSNFLRKFLTGGEKIAETKSGFGCRLDGQYCVHCGIIQMPREKHS